MDGSCENHQFEVKADNCRSCGGEFCGDCLVYTYGNDKPPFCMHCALVAAGIRTPGKRRGFRSRREQKRQARARQAALSSRVEVEQMPAPSSLVQYEFTITDDGEIEYASDFGEADIPHRQAS